MRKNYILFYLIFTHLIIHAQIADKSPDDFEGPMFFDTYHEIWNQQTQWTIYNVHDPSVLKAGDEFVMYSTDVSMGGGTPVGLHKRRSTDLVNWNFEGTAFDGPPESAMEWILQQNPNYQAQSLWAPYILKVDEEYRLYYSLSVFGTTTSFMGLATSESAFGPWTDEGAVLTTVGSDNKNAIDPSVIIDQDTGQHWMAYGSYWTGIYIVELDPETGYILNPGDQGVNVARRMGNSIEAAELFYYDGWYYLFVSYGWLEDSYNIRVGRSPQPQGPFYDFFDTNMVESTNNFPLILRPYRFNHHVGWQGTGHCSVFTNDDRYFMANQGRPSTSIFNMVLHLRELFWIDGWPVVSPQRFADVPQWEIHEDSIAGQWEHMTLVTSGFHTTPEFITFDNNGTVNGSANNTWWLSEDTLNISWNDGQYYDRLLLHWGWDWENRHVALLYTGMNQNGLNVWGKKINQEIVDSYIVIEHGSSYLIRNHHNNMLMEAQSNEENANVRIREDMGTDVQEWVLIAADDGYFQLSPINSEGKVLEINNANPNNSANIQIGINVLGDHQFWKLDYLENGYFALLSKISGDIRGADVANFAIHNGANIVQWDFLEGNNQMWRFERLQTGLDPEIPTNLADLENNEFSFNVFPNPTNNKPVSIDLREIDDHRNIIISMYDLRGVLLYRKQGYGNSIHVVENMPGPGMYILTVEIENEFIIGTEKVIIY